MQFFVQVNGRGCSGSLVAPNVVSLYVCALARLLPKFTKIQSYSLLTINTMLVLKQSRFSVQQTVQRALSLLDCINNTWKKARQTNFTTLSISQLSNQ